MDTHYKNCRSEPEKNTFLLCFHCIAYIYKAMHCLCLNLGMTLPRVSALSQTGCLRIKLAQILFSTPRLATLSRELCLAWQAVVQFCPPLHSYIWGNPLWHSFLVAGRLAGLQPARVSSCRKPTKLTTAQLGLLAKLGDISSLPEIKVTQLTWPICLNLSEIGVMKSQQS